MNLEKNIFDWPVNLNSFSTNEILGWPIKDIFLGLFMILEINNLLPNELRVIIKKLQKLLDMQENSKSIINEVIGNERKNICCPKCQSSNIVKDGTYKGKQKFKCKDCNKKFNTLTSTPFHHTRLTYGQIEEAYQCLVDKHSIRKSEKRIGVSTKTAFTLIFKLISCLKSTRTNAKLSGDMELDEYYLSINLKGTKKENMPRASKKRKSSGSSKRGISKHKVCVTSGIDECDNIYLELAGTGPVTSDMIKNTIAAKIVNPKKVITDCKSSYESIAKENKWNLKQVKSGTYVDDDRNNLANINSIHSELTSFLSTFHGVSTKHLQEYLDWFSFLKYLNYSIDYLEQADYFEKCTITKQTDIKFDNVCDNHSILDFYDVYKDYNYHPSNSTT